MNNEKMKALLASYARSVFAGGLALYMAGVTDPKDLWTALLAAAAPVAMRAINPKDPGFGKVPAERDVQAEIDLAVADALAMAKKKVAPKAAVAPKAPAATKKTTTKKTTDK